MKTLEELNALPDEELRVMLAELDGHNNLVTSCWRSHKRGIETAVPNYPRDLNACAAVEAKLPSGKLYDYDLHLRMANASSARACDFEAHLDDYVWSRSARQRTIALIFTLQPQ